MAGQDFTTQSLSLPFRKNAGGLNSTFSPTALEDNEASDLLNIDFDKSGAILKRGGYTQLNTEAVSFGGIDAYTKLLCHCDGTTTTFVDSIGTHTFVNVGPGATQLTTQYAFGGKSGFFDGTDDYIYVATHADFDWSGGIWTFDCRVYMTDLSADGIVFYKGTDADNYMKLSILTTGVLELKIVAATVTVVTMSSAAAAITAATWQHIEVSGDGTKYYMFVDGAAVTPVTDADKPAAYTLAFNIGSVDGGGTYFDGYMDEIRVSKGVCRHTTAFNVPVRPYNSETASPAWTGLKWLEKSDGTKYLVGVCGSDILATDSLTQAASPFTNRTGAVTLTANKNSHISTSVYLDYVIGANGVNLPFICNGSSDATAMTVPTGLTMATFTEVFANHVFIGNVTVSGVTQSSRVYWYEIDSVSSILDTSFRDVNKFDGQDITGIKAFGGSLVIFKRRSIWICNFTGDSDIPFVFTQSRSEVGCIAPQSIQQVENGLVFLSYDGLYYFDGNNSYKTSHRVTTTLSSMETLRYPEVVSTVHPSKNKYMLAMSLSASTENDRVVTWDSFNNAFSLYDGIEANCWALIYSDYLDINYFGDYAGFVYKFDAGSSDYPDGTETSINAYYYTKWFDYGDMVSKKASPQIKIYHRYDDTVLTLTYAYDFEGGDYYTQTLNLSSFGSLYDSAIYDGEGVVYSISGGGVKPRHITGRGTVIRFGFKNNEKGDTFNIYGFGIFAHGETNVK